MFPDRKNIETEGNFIKKVLKRVLMAQTGGD